MNDLFVSLGPLFDSTMIGTVLGADITMKVHDYINICRSELVYFAFLWPCLVFLVALRDRR